MTNARKKVIVRRFTEGPVRGYLAPCGFVRHEGGSPQMELLDLAGRVQSLPLQQVKLVSFVREFHVTDEINPERLPRRTFLARPRSEGLWVRMTLQDDDLLEGLAPLDLALADGLGQDLGLHLTPPDVRGNTQRLYVPRSAMTALQVVAVVTTPSKKKVLESLTGGHATQAQLPLALVQSTP